MKLAGVAVCVVCLSVSAFLCISDQLEVSRHAVSVGAPFQVTIPIGLIDPDVPRFNPLTREKILLGRRLFLDKSLSRDRETSCAFCHNPSTAFADKREFSKTAKGTQTSRNTPSVLNSGYLTVVGWEGYFHSLEAQVANSFTHSGDMSIDIDEAVSRIETNADYQRMFFVAFGGPPNADRLTQAIASYERSLVSGNSRVDQYLFGRKEDALNDLEREGYLLFTDKAACINCHDVFHPDLNPLGGRIATFMDNRFHNLGVGYANGQMKDVGRYEVTRDPEDWGAFKTPGLRNVALTPPYMHDGSLATLKEVVEFYNQGCIKNPNLSPGLRPLYLTKHEKSALVAFLGALTDPQLDRYAEEANDSSNSHLSPEPSK
jgi:cytochrome c peroxidase